MNKKNVIIGSLLVLYTILGAHFCLADNVVIEADKQSYNEKENMTHFEGNVKVSSKDITIKGPKALMKINSGNKPEYAVFYNNPVATKVTATSRSQIKANIMRLSLLDNLVKAEGNADMEISEDKATAISMKSNTQDFDMVNNVIIARGNVEIKYKDLNTRSSEARISVDKSGKPQKVELQGSARLVQGKNIVNADNFIYNPVTDEIIANGNTHSVTLLDDLTQVAVWANIQEYNKANGSLMTSGNVKIDYKGYVAFGPKATLIKDSRSPKPNRIVFLGRSRIREGTREVEANRIEITLNPKNFSAEGNVKTKFTQIQSYKSKPKDKRKKVNPDQDKRKKSLEEQEFRKKYPVIEKPVEDEPLNNLD